MKSPIEFVSVAQPVDITIKESNNLEEQGYLCTGQIEWDLVFEHPDLGNREKILIKHNEHMTYCKNYWDEFDKRQF